MFEINKNPDYSNAHSPGFWSCKSCLKGIAQLTGVRVDLKRVFVDGWVLEEAVIRVEHFFGQLVEPFTSNTAIVKSNLQEVNLN